MYMLPEQLDCDETLVHDFDEVNFVVNGKGRFHIDLDVLILWEAEEAE